MNAPQDAAPSLRRCLLVFTLLGPPIGWLIAFLQLALRSLELSFRGIAEAFVGFATMSVIGIPLSYVIGIAPATLTAFAYWRFRRHHNAALSVLATTMIGTLVSLLGAAIVELAGSPYIDEELRGWPYYLLPGAVAAITCGLLSDSGRSGFTPSARPPESSGV